MKTLFKGKRSSLSILVAVIVLWLGCADINQGENTPDNTAQQMETLRKQTATQVPCPSYAIQIAPNYIINKSDGSASPRSSKER